MTEEMRFHWETPEEAKDIIKQLKLKRKQMMVAKSDLTKQIAQVRADHRSRIAQRGAKTQGGGGFGKLVRRIETTSRDQDRRNVDKAVRGIEAKKAGVEGDIRTVDQAILTVEKWLLENPPKVPVPKVSAPKTPQGKEPDIVDQLERLGKLRDSGILTAEEFETKKRELLSRL